MKTIDYKFDIKSQNVKVDIPEYSTISFVKSINLEMNNDTLSHIIVKNDFEKDFREHYDFLNEKLMEYLVELIKKNKRIEENLIINKKVSIKDESDGDGESDDDGESDGDDESDDESDGESDGESENIYIERPNYKEFIKNVKTRNFLSGITIQATGTGKSFQILKLVDVYQQMNKKIQNDYLIIAPKIDILRDMFFNNNSLDKEKFIKLKKSNIIDIYKYNIVNLVTNNFNKKKFSKKKPNIIIANMQYLIFMDKNNISFLEKNLKMCIFDECHNVSGNEIFRFIENLKNIVNIGFSATPLRNTSDSLLQKFYKIYGDGKKINVISSFDIFDGISHNIILPFKHYFFKFKSCYKNNEDSDDENDSIDSDDSIIIDEEKLNYNKEIVKNIIMKNIVTKLPYEKIIGWCRTKKLACNWKSCRFCVLGFVYRTHKSEKKR